MTSDAITAGLSVPVPSVPQVRTESWGRKYIFYCTLLSIFSYRLSLDVAGLHLLLCYVFLVVNLAILAYSNWLWLPPKLLGFLAYLALSGLVGIAIGTGTIGPFVKEYAGIFMSALYAPAFLRFVRFNVQRCFHFYAKLSFYAAVFGIIAFAFHPDRLISVFLEPNDFCTICLPALFYYAAEWQRARRYGWRCLTLLIAIILTFSSAGYLAFLFGAFLLSMKYKVGRYFAPVLVFAVGIGMYTFSSDFRLRLADSVTSTVAADVSGVNNSTFGVISNLFVVQRVLQEHPFLGGGLGSHFHSHEIYIDAVPGANLFPADTVTLGQYEAQSLLLRILSEFGFIGLAGTLWFLFAYWPKDGSADEKTIAMALWCYFLLKALRQGAYFYPEVFLFIAMYAVNGALARRRLACSPDAMLPLPQAIEST